SRLRRAHRGRGPRDRHRLSPAHLEDPPQARGRGGLGGGGAAVTRGKAVKPRRTGIGRRRGPAAAPRRTVARTAGGKRMGPEVLADAGLQALRGVRERTEIGHREAGRTPPPAPPDRPIDDAIRDPYLLPVTEDEKLLRLPAEAVRPDDFTRTDTWRAMRILGEFIEGFDRLATVTKAVTVFGS